MPVVVRVLQFSDPHLVADPEGRCRGRRSLAWLRHGWQQCLAQLPQRPDLLLISGDLCQDESWGGYARLRDWIRTDVQPLAVPVALLPGNHDHPQLLRAALGRDAALAPLRLPLAGWDLLLLSSHRAGSVAGSLERADRRWLAAELAASRVPLLVALHHPPLPIGSAEFDAIALQQPQQLLGLLQGQPRVKGVVFGHIHQHWAGELARPAPQPALPLWGCPSTLAVFAAVQPCPLQQPDWPGARWLELQSDGAIHTRLLRWSPLEPA